MKNKHIKGAAFPMKLQFFAEGETTQDTGTGETESNSTKCDTPTSKETPKTFDDILSDKEYQEEYNRRLQGALEAQKSKLVILMDEKATEADKLAKMSNDEKLQYQQQKKEKELAEKEATLTKRELMAEAKNSLADAGIPLSFVELLNYKDAETCKKSIEILAVGWKQGIVDGVKKELAGGTPMKKAPQTEGITKEAYNKMGYAERLKLKTEQPALYKELAGTK